MNTLNIQTPTKVQIPFFYVYCVLMEQTYLEDTVSLSQNTNKIGVVTVHIPLANPSVTNTDHLCYRGHGMMWKTNLLSMTTSQKMKDLDRFGPPSMFYMSADIYQVTAWPRASFISR
jgi:hypothetical protein